MDQALADLRVGPAFATVDLIVEPSSSDDWTANITAIPAEERVGTAITGPAGFCKITRGDHVSPATGHRRGQATASTARRTPRQHRPKLTNTAVPDTLPRLPGCYGIVLNAADCLHAAPEDQPTCYVVG